MKEGLHFRYYCPRCHEVACGMQRHDEWIVLPHYRKGSPCLGGPVDEKADKAP